MGNGLSPHLSEGIEMNWILTVLMACNTEAEPQSVTVQNDKTSETRADKKEKTTLETSKELTCPTVKSMSKLSSFDAHPTPSEPIKKKVGESTIIDYYHYFFSTPLASFKDLDAAAAYKQKTYTLGKLNLETAYLSFSTQNTPTNWDGDSKTEWAYQMTYWVIAPTQRLVAVNKTKVTWVPSEY